MGRPFKNMQGDSSDEPVSLPADRPGSGPASWCAPDEVRRVDHAVSKELRDAVEAYEEKAESGKVWPGHEETEKLREKFSDPRLVQENPLPEVKTVAPFKGMTKG